MSSKQKPALIIVWVGTAAAIAIGYFAGTAPVPSGTFIAVGLTAFGVTLVIANDWARSQLLFSHHPLNLCFLCFLCVLPFQSRIPVLRCGLALTG